jgi:mono/diheme cytochrome c family protein
VRAGAFLGVVMGAALFAAPSTLISVVASTESTPAVQAPKRLSDTGLTELGRPFSPQYPLWSDGAVKTRWVYLPPGATIDASDETAWDLPVGTRFWKEFSFNGRKAETRMLWKTSASGWIAASYVWNEDGTDAVLAPAEGAISDVDVAPGRRHVIPSRDECLMCHGTRETTALGFTALQLSPDRDPNAIHGEPVSADMITLKTLVESRVLSNARADLLANPPQIRATDAATRSVLGYLSTNCGSCHNGRGEIAALGPVLKASELLEDGDQVARGLFAQPTKWQVPGLQEGESAVINPAVPDKSALLVRMRSRRPSSQMPPLGTSVRDDEAVGAITEWIAAQMARSH